MLSLRARGVQLCDGMSRREVLRIGGMGMLGLSLPQLLAQSTANGESLLPANSGGKAKSCILLFLMGGPPQHSTWDPKPAAAVEVRGEFGPIATNVPGVQICELLPHMAKQMDKLCLLRAVSTGDNAHSSSGYYMLTGRPHSPLNAENANPGAPNDWPNVGAMMNLLSQPRSQLPSAVRLPCHIYNTDGSVWPGQDAGFLGRAAEPWLFRCEPASTNYHIPQFTLPVDVSTQRLEGRQFLLHELNDRMEAVNRSEVLSHFSGLTQRAFGLLSSPKSREALRIESESPAVRERYGFSQFGQSVLLARRLVEAGVRLVQVNWFRGPDEPSDNPCWDSHTNESAHLKTVLVPPLDQAFSALLEELSARGILDETLVVCMAEFGRTPRFNARAGRDHWGPVFSVALAGGGIRGGMSYGASDRMGGQPNDGMVRPEDLIATIFHCLGYRPETEFHDPQGRALTITRGSVIEPILV